MKAALDLAGGRYDTRSTTTTPVNSTIKMSDWEPSNIAAIIGLQLGRTATRPDPVEKTALIGTRRHGSERTCPAMGARARALYRCQAEGGQTEVVGAASRPMLGELHSQSRTPPEIPRRP
jgi:hypothetical protein